MPAFEKWTITSEPIPGSDRAVDAWRRIQEKPTSVTIVRGSTPLAAQTVRIEKDSTVDRETEGAAGRSSMRNVTVFGITNHPTVTDTNIQREDRFVYNGTQYRIIDVLVTLGEVQARAEAAK